jgi:acetyltransferase-like isoleucine patch superfamily enzyme
MFSILRYFNGQIRRRMLHLINQVHVKYLRWKNTSADTYIAPSVQILGWKYFEVGHNSIISDDTWINVNQREGEEKSVSIGNHCFIGRRNFFTSGTLIKIGDYCLTGINCKFLGSGHVYDSPFTPYIIAGTTDGGTIDIGANCWLGADVTIMKNVKIGYGCVIGASTLVNRDIPPLSLVVGNPCRIIKRYSMKNESWVRVNEELSYDDDLPSDSDYLSLLNKSKFDMKGFRVAASQKLGDL